MKINELFEADGRGQQIFQFLDYLETRCPLKKVSKEHLKKLGAHLLKNGWTYTIGPSNSDFVKGTNDTERFRIVPPEKHWAGRRDIVKYYYFSYSKVSPTDDSPVTIASDVPVRNLEDMLSDLRSLSPLPPV